MKNLYCLAYFLFVSASMMGQDSTVALQRIPRLIIKFAPLSLLDQDATVQAGLEYRIAPMTSMQAEVGYGWQGLSVFQADLDGYVKAEVWRFRAETRFYTGRYRTNYRRRRAVRSHFPLGNYWAIEGLAKQINITDREYAPFIPPNTTREYVGLKQVSRYIAGAHLKIGRQFAFYDPLKRRFSRTLLDIYLGAGVRWAVNDIRRSGLGAPAECGCGIGRSFDKAGSQWMPSLAGGLKIGFAP